MQPEPMTGRALPVGSPSCCCPSAAAVTVVISTAGVTSGEFLLCAHHYRSLRSALRARNALVYGRDGHLLDVPNDPYWT